MKKNPYVTHVFSWEKSKCNQFIGIVKSGSERDHPVSLSFPDVKIIEEQVDTVAVPVEIHNTVIHIDSWRNHPATLRR